MNSTRDSALAMHSKVLPELSMFLSVLLLAVNPGGLLTPDPDEILFALAADAVSLMFFCTLVDIASRVQKRPPWWLVGLIVGGVLLMNSPVLDVLAGALEAGLWIFVPLAWSLLERIRELWTLPGCTDVEKIRRRTLTFDRLWVGLHVAGAVVLVVVVYALSSDDALDGLFDSKLPFGAALAFYGTATYNAWRVHQPAFAKRPTSLVPWLDRGDGTDLSPM